MPHDDLPKYVVTDPKDPRYVPQWPDMSRLSCPFCRCAALGIITLKLSPESLESLRSGGVTELKAVGCAICRGMGPRCPTIEEAVRMWSKSMPRDELNESSRKTEEKLLVTKPAIQVWRFSDAPAHLQELSPHGGDEDWLALLPVECVNDMVPWMETGTPFGVCDVSEATLPDGRVVRIGAHS